jgi:hypothetical protein
LANQSAAIKKAIEEAFGIRLSEDDIRASRTLGELSEFLNSRSRGSSHDQLECAGISYLLKLGLYEACDIAPSSVTPQARLDVLFSRSSRQEKWNTLADAAQISLPSLVHPRWLAIGTLVVCLAAMALGVALFWSRWTTDERLFALIVAPFWPFMLWWMALYFSRGLASSFPRDCQTFGELVQRAARMNQMESPAAPEGSPDDNAEGEDLVWKVLQALIAVETGRALNEVSPETRVQDVFQF